MLIAEIKQVNKAKGGHFFDRSTLRFFNSKVLPYTWSAPGGRTFFVTSEQQDDEHPRLYTVRVFDEATGHIATHGAFQGYLNAPKAYMAARNASLEGVSA